LLTSLSFSSDGKSLNSNLLLTKAVWPRFAMQAFGVQLVPPFGGNRDLVVHGDGTHSLHSLAACAWEFFGKTYRLATIHTSHTTDR